MTKSVQDLCDKNKQKQFNNSNMTQNVRNAGF